MPLCFYITYVLQFFSSNTRLKCSKLGTRRQLPKKEFGEGKDFWFGGHKSINEPRRPVFTCDDTRFLLFNFVADTIIDVSKILTLGFIGAV